MTDQEINMAIEKACGGPFFGLKKQGYWYRPNAHGYTGTEREAWRLTLGEAKGHEYLHGDFDGHVYVVELSPRDYCSDLNAMHEAEKILGNGQHERFELMLIEACQKRELSWVHGESKQFHTSERYPWHAPAGDRAEAFLRTLSLWKD